MVLVRILMSKSGFKDEVLIKLIVLITTCFIVIMVSLIKPLINP
jgi:hypothetical protein